jgi:hypothetical protein
MARLDMLPHPLAVPDHFGIVLRLVVGIVVGLKPATGEAVQGGRVGLIAAAVLPIGPVAPRVRRGNDDRVRVARDRPVGLSSAIRVSFPVAVRPPTVLNFTTLALACREIS